MPSAIRFDTTVLTGVEKTADGILRAPARLSRVGVLTYRFPDGTARRELRPPEEVFDAASVESFAHVPLVVSHPGLVTAATMKQHRVGFVRGEARRDGDYLAATVQVDDAEVVARVDSGELKELSCGYRLEFDPTPGVWRGQAYDGVQRKIRGNHVGLGPAGWGRAGSECSIRLDGEADVAIATVSEGSPRRNEMTLKLKGVDIRLDAAEQAIVESTLTELREDATNAKAAIAGAEAKASAASARADAAEAKADAAKARADAAEAKLTGIDRTGIESAAKEVLGADTKFDGKSDADVRSSVVAKVFPTIRMDGQSVDYQRAMFDSAMVSFRTTQPEGGKVLGAITRTDGGVALTPREEHIKRQRERATKASA